MIDKRTHIAGNAFTNDVEGSAVDYFDWERYDTTMCNDNTMSHGYQTAREYCDNHHIKIMNSTRE